MNNVNAMKACVQKTLALVSKGHEITSVPAGKYEKMTAYGIMKFHVKQYAIKDLGNLSVMTMNAALMQMATIVFSPMEKNLPLLSIDYMYILGNRKAYIELYDLVKEKDAAYMDWLEKYDSVKKSYSNLEDTTATPAWYAPLLTVTTYKAGKKKDDDRLIALLLDIVKVYLAQADSYSLMGAPEKAEKVQMIKEYSDRLISEGGISTDFFKKALGEDVTRDFFDQVFFGTEKYMEG